MLEVRQDALLVRIRNDRNSTQGGLHDAVRFAGYYRCSTDDQLNHRPPTAARAASQTSRIAQGYNAPMTNEINDYIRRAEAMVRAIYAEHPELDDLVQIGRIAAVNGLHTARKVANRDYCDAERRKFVRIAILRDIHDYLNAKANKPLFSLDTARPDHNPEPLTPPGPASVAVALKLSPAEVHVLNAMADTYMVSRARILKLLIHLGYDSIAATMQRIYEETNDPAG